MHLNQNDYFNKTKTSFVTSLFKYDEILIERAEVFMINIKYHIINYVINDQSAWLSKNQ
jgi:hypothetical protein